MGSRLATTALFSIVACGGQTTGDASAGACTLSAGTYSELLTLTSDAGVDTHCSVLPPETLTLSGSESYSGFAGTTTADGGCTSQFDSSTCTFSSSCSIPLTNGGMDTTSFTFTIADSAATGEETISIAVPGIAPSTCAYALSITKN